MYGKLPNKKDLLQNKLKDFAIYFGVVCLVNFFGNKANVSSYELSNG